MNGYKKNEFNYVRKYKCILMNNIIMSCNFTECKRKCALIIGNCKFCEKHYCLVHRLPEDHKCEKLDECKKKSFEKNKNKLMNEKIEEIKI